MSKIKIEAKNLQRPLKDRYWTKLVM